MATLDIDADAFLVSFDRAMTGLDARVSAAVKETMGDVHSDAATLCPVDTGRLRSSIYDTTRRTARQVVGEVGTRGVPYAVIVEFGSQPHEIVAHGSGMLRFTGRDGQVVFRKRVHHPGTRPYAFFRGAWLRAPGHFRRCMGGG